MTEKNESPTREWLKMIGTVIFGVGSLWVAYQAGTHSQLVLHEQILRNDWEQRHSAAMIPYNTKLAEMDAELKTVQSRELTARGTVAQIEASKAIAPTFVVKPSIIESLSVNDLREIDLDLVMENIGVVPVDLTEMKISVFESTPTKHVQDIIARTQRMYHESQQIDQLQLVDFEQASVRAEELNQFWEQRGEQCPHGQLFAIDTTSTDVEWRPIERLTRKVPLDIDIAPGTSVMQRFKYLLTEYPTQHHRQWFRFRVEVASNEDKTAKIYEFVVSGHPLERDYRVVNQTSGRTTTGLWQPQSPLVPLVEP